MDKNLLLQLVLVILLVCAGVFAFVRFDAESIPCIKNPFVHGARTMAEKYDGTVSCACTIYGKEDVKKFSFTEKEFNPSQKTTYQNNPLQSNAAWNLAK